VLGLTFIFVMIFAPEGIVGKLGALLARASRKSTN
jgi:ABC-type branched-subunit amino acid transport system permease subunit